MIETDMNSKYFILNKVSGFSRPAIFIAVAFIVISIGILLHYASIVFAAPTITKVSSGKLFFDDFNRASLGSGYSASGTASNGWALVNNKLRFTSKSGNGQAYLNQTTTSIAPDSIYEFTLNYSSNSLVAPRFHAQRTNNSYYMFDGNHGTASVLYRFISNSPTIIGTQPFTWNTNQNYRIKMRVGLTGSGSSKMWVNDALVTTATDATPLTAPGSIRFHVGNFGSGATVDYDNVAAYKSTNVTVNGTYGSWALYKNDGITRVGSCNTTAVVDYATTTSFPVDYANGSAAQIKVFPSGVADCSGSASAVYTASGGNEIFGGDVYNFSEPTPDTTPPVRSNGQPTGTLPTGTTQTTLSLSTNEIATCRYSTTAATPYASMTNTFTTTGATSHATQVTGLSDGSTYNFYVRCIDQNNNSNTDDLLITFTIDVPGVVWSPITNLTAGGITYSNLGAGGNFVYACYGDGTLNCRRSINEGATWQPWVNLGPGTLYLERPIAVSGSTVAVVTVDVSDTVTDFWGPRPVGDIDIRISRDNGATFEAARRLTTGAKTLRQAVAISGNTFHLVWMDYRTGQWDIHYLRSIDAGVTWEPEIILVNGTNAVGAERPIITAQGNTVNIAWMDARDNQPPCTIEGGTYLPVCTEIYNKRSTDGGVTWSADVRLTNDAPYSGRPDIAASGSNVVIVYDHRVAGSTNDLGIIRSTDGGATFTTPQLFVTDPLDQTHGTLAYGAGGLDLVMIDGSTGTNQIGFRRSINNGVTWTAGEQLSTAGDAGAPGIAQSLGYTHVSWASPNLQYRRASNLSPTPTPTPTPTGTPIPTTTPTLTPTPTPSPTPIPGITRTTFGKVFFDDFNRATLGSNYAADGAGTGNWGILGNRAQYTSTNQAGLAFLQETLAAAPANTIYEYVFNTTSFNSVVPRFAAQRNGSNFYLFDADLGNAADVIRANPSWTNIIDDVFTYAVNTDYRVKLKVGTNSANGTKLWINEVLKANATDTAPLPSSGYAALAVADWNSGITVKFDNLSVYKATTLTVNGTYGSWALYKNDGITQVGSCNTTATVDYATTTSFPVDYTNGPGAEIKVFPPGDTTCSTFPSAFFIGSTGNEIFGGDVYTFTK